MPRQLGPSIELCDTVTVAASATDQVAKYTGLSWLDGPVAIVGILTQQQAGSTGFLKADLEMPGGSRKRMCVPIKSIAAENPQYLPTEWTNDISEAGYWRLAAPVAWKRGEELVFHLSNTDSNPYTLSLYLQVVQITDADADAIRALGLIPAVMTARYTLAANAALNDDAGGTIEMSKDLGFVPYWQYVVSTGLFTHNWRFYSIEAQQQAMARSGADGGYKRSAFWSRSPTPKALWTGTGISRPRAPRQYVPAKSLMYLKSLDTSALSNTVVHYLIGLATLELSDTPATIAEKLSKLSRIVGVGQLAA